MLTVFLGSLLGLFFGRSLKEETQNVVYISIGLISLLIGITMALEGTRILFMALSLILGGALGTALDLEGRIVSLGEFLHRLILRGQARGKPSKGSRDEVPPEDETSPSRRVGTGFLNASVLFCVGAMTIIGAFRAGVEGDLELLLTKSVMDGFMAIMMTAAMGIGVIFSVITILVYQGGLTLLSAWAAPWVSDLILSEITGVGGLMIMMIGINLLGLKKIKTADFIPALVVIVLFAGLEPLVIGWFQ